MSNFGEFRRKMEADGVREAAILAFERSYELFVSEESGLIGEEQIEPVEDLARLAEESVKPEPELFGQVAVIKLNGGLGTSMGLRKAKSLLEVREGMTFLDLILKQIRSLRAESAREVQFLLMNSFGTSADTLDYLRRHAFEGIGGVEEMELMQNQVPKIDATSLQPVEWPANPELEWCPPGHGDLYPALLGSGRLEQLLEEGVKYAFISNSDNLGAVLDGKLLSLFAQSGAPFLMEVTRRTEIDRKGGHLARRVSDTRLVLREVAQCPQHDFDSFQDIARHRFFNTNNLWVRLDSLREALEAGGGVLPLPTICNRKTVDPRDRNSTAILQLETAMGAAIECFEGGLAIEVPRSRFAPVKETSDLLLLRSDAYHLGEDGRVVLAPERRGVPPVVRLDSSYKLVDQLEELGVPSLVGADSLSVAGPVPFEAGAVIEGKVEIASSGTEPLLIDRLVRNESVTNPPD